MPLARLGVAALVSVSLTLPQLALAPAIRSSSKSRNGRARTVRERTGPRTSASWARGASMFAPDGATPTTATSLPTRRSGSFLAWLLPCAYCRVAAPGL